MHLFFWIESYTNTYVLSITVLPIKQYFIENKMKNDHEFMLNIKNNELQCNPSYRLGEMLASSTLSHFFCFSR